MDKEFSNGRIMTSQYDPRIMASLTPGANFEPFADSRLQQSFPDNFEQLVNRFPEQLAIKSEYQSYTYSRMNQVANNLARGILAHAGEVVALSLVDPVETITAMIAVLKTGRCFVILDSLNPVSRNAYIVEDAGARIVVSNSDRRELVENLNLAGRVMIDYDRFSSEPFSDNLNLPISPDMVMAIMYTSGSTGTPKGVLRKQSDRLFSAKQNINNYYHSSADRFALLTSPGFGASSGAIHPPLMVGGSIHAYDFKQQGVANLANWLRAEGITVIHLTPSLFRAFAESLTDEEEFPDLRLIFLGGEAVLASDVHLFKKFFAKNGTVLRHSFASTETGSVTVQLLDMHTEITTPVVPSGYPIPGLEVFIWDENDRQVAQGEAGEIIVRGRTIGRRSHGDRPGKSRLWEDPQETGVYFYRTGDLGRILPDGRLLHLGRKDNMVKIRGYRVELSEIENALLAHPQIRQAAVSPHANDPERLVGYLVPLDVPPEISRLRQDLAKGLPAYMIPALFVFLDQLPLTPSGKVARRELPVPSLKRPELAQPYAAPRTVTEEQLVKIWTDVLRVEGLGIHDDFFDLGGHSLLAVRLINRVLRATGTNLLAGALLQTFTVAEMANLIDTNPVPSSTSDQFDLEQLLSEVENLTDEEVSRILQEGE